ncbi:RNA-guided endonuclease InsQ/TnpB family protein [Herbidospora solisilvae]|nr:RNA-guided endonuclease TnpB family protein [Herbidospora solisilvae]
MRDAEQRVVLRFFPMRDAKLFAMSRYRLQPTQVQAAALLEHCRHARFVWNLAAEQSSFWKPGRGPAPGFAEQCRQLTEARAEYAWLRAGSAIVQQQALKDFARAMAQFFARTHRKPTFRRRGQNEGFRIVAFKKEDVRRLSRNVGEVKIPKVGWVRFRWSRAVPDGAKSFRVNRDQLGRWFVAFAVAPEPIARPCSGEVVGVDRGVAVSAALSTGELLRVPTLRAVERARLLKLIRQLARARKGSKRRDDVRTAIGRLRAGETARRKDWVEKVTTSLARRFDVIGVEDLRIGNMTRSARGTIEAPGRNVRQKAGLNRSILSASWGRLVMRLEDKAPGRVIKVNPAFTSQRCSVCGVVDGKARESQAAFRCRSCGHAGNADVNAAKNIEVIAAGHAVNARGGDRKTGPGNREPQLVLRPV